MGLFIELHLSQISFLVGVESSSREGPEGEKRKKGCTSTTDCNTGDRHISARTFERAVPFVVCAPLVGKKLLGTT